MWLLAVAVRLTIEQAQRKGLGPTADQRAEYEARYGYDSDSSPRILTIAGDIAEIQVSGVITKAPSFMAMVFGGGNVTYPEITAALAEADRNPDVGRAILRIDSPGGHVDGLFDTLAAMESFSKPLTAEVHNWAASAAYALASQADEIVAANRAVQVGSIGVAKSYWSYEEEVDITSTKAPKKRPDVTTEEGKKVVREELDAIHELFVESIASGRATTPDRVNTEFGQGAVLLADEALKRGMIDAIAQRHARVVKSGKSTQSAGSGGQLAAESTDMPMDINQLRAEHPTLYAEVVQVGVAQERDRVVGHLNLAQGSGLMDDAIAAVTEGSELNHAVTTKHMMAAVNRRDQENRQGDEDAAAAAADGAQGDEPDSGDAVAALVEQSLGITAAG